MLWLLFISIIPLLDGGSNISEFLFFWTIANNLRVLEQQQQPKGARRNTVFKKPLFWGPSFKLRGRRLLKFFFFFLPHLHYISTVLSHLLLFFQWCWMYIIWPSSKGVNKIIFGLNPKWFLFLFSFHFISFLFCEISEWKGLFKGEDRNEREKGRIHMFFL
jgi:hypothetical protein